MFSLLRIHLVMGDSLPPTIIPIASSKTQAGKVLVSPMKQVCFILNGSSKAIMSFYQSTKLENLGQCYYEKFPRFH
ncbi:AIF_collapsed_G0010910.mRNA.1.CDS.1 [Saccharomyces cerevisiae]|nr:AIF_collapsed_G0010910.mRNA.1.CDS.1 [Saccharomyces cerevisiae]